MTTLVLASTSPRRRELVRLTGWPVTFLPTDVDESPVPGETGEAMVSRLAAAKVMTAVPGNGDIVLAADTTVILDGESLGKPSDAGEARAMLRRLRGRDHRVVTAIAVRTPDGRLRRDACESVVPMRAYGDDEIEASIEVGEPFDKAGGYAIQQGSLEPVDRSGFKDCYANVVGLPLCHLARTLRRVGLAPAADIPAACIAATGYDCRIHEAILEGIL
jgi:septum formation protein